MMKRFVFCLLVLLTSVIVVHADNVVKSGLTTMHSDVASIVDTLHNDTKQIVSTVHDDIKGSLSTLYPDVKSAVTYIAKGLGVAAEHVYMVLVKKYVVLGAKELFILILGLVLVIIGSHKWSKNIRIVKARYDEEDNVSTSSVLPWVVMPTLMFLIGLILCFNVDYENMLMGLINPEYGAINYIIDTAKEMSGK